MLNEIKVPHGKMKILGEIFKRSHPYIRKVLRGERDKGDAREIRSTAISRLAGRELKEVEKSNNDTNC